MPWNWAINPGKIVEQGGSGGAHLVRRCGDAQGLRRAGRGPDDLLRPQHTGAYSIPCLDTSKKDLASTKFPSADDAKRANLMNAIAPGLPPVVMFHGTTDRVVPFETSLEFSRKIGRRRRTVALVFTKVRGTASSISTCPSSSIKGTRTSWTTSSWRRASSSPILKAPMEV